MSFFSWRAVAGQTQSYHLIRQSTVICVSKHHRQSRRLFPMAISYSNQMVSIINRLSYRRIFFLRKILTVTETGSFFNLFSADENIPICSRTEYRLNELLFERLFNYENIAYVKLSSSESKEHRHSLETWAFAFEKCSRTRVYPNNGTKCTKLLTTAFRQVEMRPFKIMTKCAVGAGP